MILQERTELYYYPFRIKKYSFCYSESALFYNLLNFNTCFSYDISIFDSSISNSTFLIGSNISIQVPNWIHICCVNKSLFHILQAQSKDLTWLAADTSTIKSASTNIY
ncbi:hypothetical protein Glove_63g49 [Diversispora epigaea]|uniref:Uncharacterized protein n=1 Tax=Diversispora epigaea TaxID=1348612 RepID=A0A397JET2_9GLOM|nr:hypothetical protein Glove_63g49 [Diversispora epigaea]